MFGKVNAYYYLGHVANIETKSPERFRGHSVYSKQRGKELMKSEQTLSMEIVCISVPKIDETVDAYQFTRC